MSASTLPDRTADELVSACRTSAGDRLRSVTHFTSKGYDQLYLRDDLERDADLDSMVSAERDGFASREAYDGSELGGYEFTIRAFEHGYVTRVIAGDRGVFVTTDRMSLTRFEDVASAVEPLL